VQHRLTPTNIVTLDSHRPRDLEYRGGAVPRRAYAAAIALLRERPEITMGTVAARAGIHQSTLRALFSSPDVLVGAACLGQLYRMPLVIDFDQAPHERVRSQFIELLRRTADEPGFALCCMRVLTGRNPAVRGLRAEVDAELQRRLNAALGSGAWPELCQILHFSLVGAFTTTMCTSSSLPEIESRTSALISAVFPGSPCAP
jgi:AcrR family transcriptional regulator